LVSINDGPELFDQDLEPQGLVADKEAANNPAADKTRCQAEVEKSHGRASGPGAGRQGGDGVQAGLEAAAVGQAAPPEAHVSAAKNQTDGHQETE
jgi:hypothetical protein